jgi:putative nucleotidyltransferase with HDIG domain
VGLQDKSYLQVLLRALIFAAAFAMVGIVLIRLGFPRPEAITIMAVGGILSALAVKLPWGGFLFPGDALLICLGLLTGMYQVALVGLGMAIASASIVNRWRHTVLVAVVRNMLAVLVTVAVWRMIAPSLRLMVDDGARSIWLPGGAVSGWMISTQAVPAILIASLAFITISTVIENLLRPNPKHPFGEAWLLNAGRNLHHLIFTALLGALAAVAYRDIGMAAFVFFAIPVLLTRDALKRSLELRASRFEALKALSSSVDARDKYTFDHSGRVSRLAGLLAREMGFAETVVEQIQSGALLHDIGKLSVDTEILSKPGPLDPSEREAIQRHPLHSAEVVSRVGLLDDSTEIVRHHHERPDGNGYPSKLRGHEIPVGARILNVADAFDAMTSDRPYRKKKSIDEAIKELKEGSGTEFDAVVVEYLSRFLAKMTEEIRKGEAA